MRNDLQILEAVKSIPSNSHTSKMAIYRTLFKTFKIKSKIGRFRSRYARFEKKNKEFRKEIERILKNPDELHNAYCESVSLVQKLKMALQVHRTKTFFRPDAVFIRGVDTVIQEIESSVDKLGKLFTSSQVTGSINKNEIKAELDASVDITPPASDAGIDVGLNDSTGIRQSSQVPVQSTGANDTQITNSGRSRSWKRKRRHSELDCCAAQPRKIRRSPVNHFNNENGENQRKNDGERNTGGEKEEYEVEKIIDYDIIKGKCLYQVRWRGYKSDDDTWEPLENLTGCEEILLSFIRTRLAERSHITDPEELKTVLLPCEESLKPLLRTAFFAQLTAPAQADVEAALPTLLSNKIKIKIKRLTELEEDVDKLVAIKDCLSDQYKKGFEDLKQQLVLRECKQQRDRHEAELLRREREMKNCNIGSSA